MAHIMSFFKFLFSKITKKGLSIAAGCAAGACIFGMSLYIAYLSGQNSVLQAAQNAQGDPSQPASSSSSSAAAPASSSASSGSFTPSSVPAPTEAPAQVPNPAPVTVPNQAPTVQTVPDTPAAPVTPEAPPTPTSVPLPDNSQRISAIRAEIASLQAQIDAANATYNATVPPLQAAADAESAQEQALWDAQIAARREADAHPDLEGKQGAARNAAANYSACIGRKDAALAGIAQAQADLDAVLGPANIRLAELQAELAALQ